MRAVLEFSLPNEAGEFETAQRGGLYLAAIQGWFDDMRSELKYSEQWSPDQKKALEYARAMMVTCCEERGIDV